MTQNKEFPVEGCHEGKYDDIITLPHHEPLRHPRMSMQARAAQFSSFAALNGHEEAIERATARHESEAG